jgi:hypothetical protein
LTNSESFIGFTPCPKLPSAHAQSYASEAGSQFVENLEKNPLEQQRKVDLAEQNFKPCQNFHNL